MKQYGVEVIEAAMFTPVQLLVEIMLSDILVGSSQNAEVHKLVTFFFCFYLAFGCMAYHKHDSVA